MATILGSLLVSLGLETGEFKSGLSAAEKDLRRSTKRIENIGKSMTNLGQKMSIAVTAPIVGMFYKSVQGAQDQAQAMAQVNAALASMGGASGKTAAELLKVSDALEMRSLFDGDVILKQITANLLTFGNVAGEQFDRAQQAAVDMATRLGGEPQAAAVMLGKALNDPIKGISALTRVGVQFTEAQKAQIAAMAEANNVAGAQGIILSEVERQFAGAAQAAADTSPWRTAQVAIGQAMDVIGEAIIPVIKPAAEAIASLARGFAALPEPMQKGVVAVAALAAVFGPLLIGFGAIVTATAPFTAALAALFSSGGILLAAKGAVIGLTAAFGPWLAVIGAVAAAGYLIYQNWDKIAPVLQDLWNTIQATLGPPLERLISAVKEAFSALWNGPLGPMIQKVVPVLQALHSAFLSAFGSTVIIAIKGLAVAIGVAFDAIGLAIRAVVALFDGSFKTAIVNAVRYIYLQVKAWLLDKLAAVWDGVKNKINEVKGYFYNLYDAVVGHSYIPDMVDGIAAQMARLDAVLVNPAKTATERTKQAFEQLATDIDGIMRDLFPDAAAAAGFIGQRSKIQKAIEAGGAGGYSVSQLQAGLGALQNKEFEHAFKDFTVAANDTAESVETANVRVVKSFKDMADDTVSVLQNLSNSLRGGGFLDILGSVIGFGLQLGSIGAFGKGIQKNINSVPKYAGGANFHPGGLAIVGERGPEVVDMPRGSRVTPNHKISGGTVNNYFGPGAEEFWGKIAQGDAQAAGAGSTGAQVAMAVKSSRRFP